MQTADFGTQRKKPWKIVTAMLAVTVMTTVAVRRLETYQCFDRVHNQLITGTYSNVTDRAPYAAWHLCNYHRAEAGPQLPQSALR